MGASRDVVERAFACWNAGDVEGLAVCYAADAELKMPGTTVQGRDQIKGVWHAFIAAFPGSQLREIETVESGVFVASEHTFTGTHTAPFVTPQGEIAPTGRHVTLDGITLV